MVTGELEGSSERKNNYKADGWRFSRFTAAAPSRGSKTAQLACSLITDPFQDSGFTLSGVVGKLHELGRELETLWQFLNIFNFLVPSAQ